MGRRRRRRKIVVKVKKKLPTVFQCPRCGYVSVSVTVEKASDTVTVRCSSCGLSKVFEVQPYLQPVDYYSRFLDWFEKGESVESEGVPEEQDQSG